MGHVAKGYRSLRRLPWRVVLALLVLWVFAIWPSIFPEIEEKLRPIARVTNIEFRDTPRGMVVEGRLVKLHDCDLAEFDWRPHDKAGNRLPSVHPVLLRDGERRGVGNWQWGPWLFEDKTAAGTGRLVVKGTYAPCADRPWFLNMLWRPVNTLLDASPGPPVGALPAGLTGRNDG